MKLVVLAVTLGSSSVVAKDNGLGLTPPVCRSSSCVRREYTLTLVVDEILDDPCAVLDWRRTHVTVTVII